MYIEADLNKVVDILLTKLMKLEKENAYLIAKDIASEQTIKSLKEEKRNIEQMLDSTTQLERGEDNTDGNAK